MKQILYIDWIGKIYYTEGTFIQEAEKQGVSRRFPAFQGKSIKWGDRIYVAIKDESSNACKLFGYYTVDKIFVSKEDLPKIPLDRIEYINEFFTPEEISRECGDYSVVMEITVDLPIESIVGQGIGFFMVGGKFTKLEEPKFIPLLKQSRSMRRIIADLDQKVILEFENRTDETTIVEEPDKKIICIVDNYKRK